MLNKKNILECGYCISTVSVPFLAWFGEYETAMNINGNVAHGWVILKGYDTIEEALEGHEEFINMSKEELDKVERIG